MTNQFQLSFSMTLFGLTLFSSLSAQAACRSDIPVSAVDSRYEILATSNGSEIRDKLTGLIWQRCSVGQTWNGNSCDGSATLHSWTDALLQVESYGSSWRLPNIKELQGLRETSCIDPAINTRFFPDTERHQYWSSSPNTSNGNNAWFVEFSSGATSNYSKSNGSYVRAVR